jgi:hypothetical protein
MIAATRRGLTMYEIKSVSGRSLFVSDSANDVRAALQEASQRGANLREANLREANLREANLRGADLREANLRGANLWEADLRGANLRGADLRGADLWGANLWEANLWEADLRGADLWGADLWEANLRGAKNIPALAAAQTVVAPANTVLYGWKKAADGVIVELKIPAKAKRTNATGRKCRAEYAKVVAVHGADEAYSTYDSSFVYRVGETVWPTNGFNEDRWDECASGIHFFITREEAEAY